VSKYFRCGKGINTVYSDRVFAPLVLPERNERASYENMWFILAVPYFFHVMLQTDRFLIGIKSNST